MIKTKSNILLALGIVSLFSVSAFADEKAPSFADLLNSYQKQSGYEETLNAYQQSASAQAQSSSSWMASDVGLTVHHETDVFNKDLPSRNWQVGASVDFKLPKQRDSMQKLAGLVSQSPEIEKRYSNWLASGHLRELIWNYKKAEQQLELDKQTLEVSQSLLDMVSQQVQLGERSELDKMVVEQRYLGDEMAYQVALTTFENNRNAYQKWSGYSALPSVVNEQKVATLNPQHPELAKLSFQSDQNMALLDVKRAEKSGTPSFFMGLQTDQVENQNQDSVIVELTLPLGINPESDRMVAEQKLAATQARFHLQKKRTEIELSLEQLENQLNAAAQALKASKAKLRLAEKALTLANKAYRLGDLNIQILLQTQQQTIESRKAYLNAEIEYGRLQAEYNQQAGYILGEKQ